MFPSGYPVLCSSGRAAIVLALSESNIGRRDLIGIFPYASHCVIDAVARLGTPLSGPTSIDADLRLVYHQWGFVQEAGLIQNTIEDCVDTLCIPGTDLFPGGGCFEIWSLPKIIGTTSGGVLWCKDEKTAKSARKLRDERGNGVARWIIRLLAKKFTTLYDYWQGAEGAAGSISRFQTGEIMMAINNWDTIVADRISKIKIAWPLAMEWLSMPDKRLPPVIPIPANVTESNLLEMGLLVGHRMIEKIESDGARKMIKVIPLPIHQDIPEYRLKELVIVLSKNE